VLQLLPQPFAAAPGIEFIQEELLAAGVAPPAQISIYPYATIQGSLVLAGGFVFYLWFTLLSPFGYQPPENQVIMDGGQPHSLFVFGTLRQPWVRWLVMGRTGDTEPAVLEGYRKEALDITPATGSRVKGEVIEVDSRELARLDRYERLGVRYERTPMELADGQIAWVYRRLPGS